jgi:hypothetical protein
MIAAVGVIQHSMPEKRLAVGVVAWYNSDQQLATNARKEPHE